MVHLAAAGNFEDTYSPFSLIGLFNLISMKVILRIICECQEAEISGLKNFISLKMELPISNFSSVQIKLPRKRWTT